MTGNQPAVSAGAAAIAGERRRQVEVEGYTAEHDKKSGSGVLSGAAVAYLTGNAAWWPWSQHLFTPCRSDDQQAWRRDLVRAGALIAAAIDALDGES